MDEDKKSKKIDTFNVSEVIEQTFLSWVQTGLTLIGVGFGIGSILVMLKEYHYETAIITVIRIIGQLSIFVGFVTILLALVQHREKLKNLLSDQERESAYVSRLPVHIGITIALLGFIGFVAILVHMVL